MLATIFLHVSMLMLPGIAPPTDGCQREVVSPAVIEQRTLEEFNHAIGDYVTLHRRLERTLPPEQMFDDAEDMFAAVEALRFAIVEARPMAQKGNIFSPAVATLIRSRLEDVIADKHYDPKDVLAAINAERLPGTPDPEVNGTYPWGIGSAMWPTLLQALPPLPRELEYRFANRDLVLIDIHADLVVDILDDALPAAIDTDYAHR